MRFLFALLVVLFLGFPWIGFSQEITEIDGKTYELTTEVEGPMTLLWSKEGKKFRFFSKKEGEIVELKNTKTGGKFQEEYKEVLKNQTRDISISSEKVKFTPRSLAAFFNEYNRLKDPEYALHKKESDLEFRLGFFGGVDNVIFTDNINNSLHGIGGIDFELVDPKLKHHALVLQLKQTFKTDDHDYSSSEMSFNYRFKFLVSEKMDVFINFRFAAFYFSEERYEVFEENDPNGSWISYSDSGFGVGAPLTFGIGADYKIGNGYLTFGFQDIFGLNVTSNKEFPIHFSLGYKWVL